MTEENKVFSAAPTDERVPEEKAAYELLDRLGVAYTRTDHPVAQTMEDCQRAEELLGVKICKNLFLCNRQKTSFYLLMMPGDKPFKTKDLSAQIGSARLSFAGEEFMKELLGVAPGSVSVLGLMNDHDKKVRLLISFLLLISILLHWRISNILQSVASFISHSVIMVIMISVILPRAITPGMV